jgi:hypothetical protein
VANVLRGYNATVFAYGQTGTGKTHTIMGCMENHDDQNDRNILPSSSSSSVSRSDLDTPEVVASRASVSAPLDAWGIIPRTLFELVHQLPSIPGLSITCAYMQIYNDKIYDLLMDRKRQKPLALRETKLHDDISISGLAYIPMTCLADVFRFLKRGYDTTDEPTY